MKIEDWLKVAKKQITVLDAELLALKCFAPKEADRSWLVTHDVVKITTEMQQKADEMLKNEPLEYH